MRGAPCLNSGPTVTSTLPAVPPPPPSNPAPGPPHVAALERVGADLLARRQCLGLHEELVAARRHVRGVLLLRLFCVGGVGSGCWCWVVVCCVGWVCVCVCRILCDCALRLMMGVVVVSWHVVVGSWLWLARRAGRHRRASARRVLPLPLCSSASNLVCCSSALLLSSSALSTHSPALSSPA